MASKASKYRGAVLAHCSSVKSYLTAIRATVEDLDPPAALSLSPTSSISHALLTSYSHDYTHLTITDPSTRALLGYISMPRLQELLKAGDVTEDDPVEKAMQTFRRKGRRYRVISLETPLEDLEEFFDGGGTEQKQDFAVVTDAERKFVLGVVTRADLDEFVRRRPT